MWSDSLPRLGAIIPNLNGGEMLSECVRSLVSEAPPGFEGVIVDNGSTDGSADAACAIDPHRLRIHRNRENRGFAQACNQGAALLGSAEVLLFLNSDAFLERHSLIQLLAFGARSPDTAIWQPLILSADGSNIDSAGSKLTRWGFLWHLATPESKQPYPVFATKGAAMFVRRSIFDDLGGFCDGYFAYFEDSDLCWRARLMGHEVRVVPTSTVRHVSGATTRRIFPAHKIDLLSFRNRIRSILTNGSPRLLASMVPLHVVGCLGAAVAMLLSGRPRSGLAILRSVVWPMGNASQIRHERSLVQSRRRIDDRSLLRPDLIVRMSPRRAIQLMAAYRKRWDDPS